MYHCALPKVALRFQALTFDGQTHMKSMGYAFQKKINVGLILKINKTLYRAKVVCNPGPHNKLLYLLMKYCKLLLKSPGLIQLCKLRVFQLDGLINGGAYIREGL